jgi:hypothetical protein
MISVFVGIGVMYQEVTNLSTQKPHPPLDSRERMAKDAACYGKLIYNGFCPAVNCFGRKRHRAILVLGQ